MSDPEKGSQDRNERINLVNNVNARIQNPLHGIPQDKLLAQVEEFTKEKEFDEYTETFKKGALLAQRPGELETLPLLDEADREAIRRERTHKWSQPKDLCITIIICSLAAVVQGWDQTGSNAANLSFPTKFGISTNEGDPNRERDDWIIGAINAAPYIACALLGCWLTDPLNNYLGRRGTIFVCGIFCTITVIGSAFSQTWPQLFVCRLFLGLGMGPKASTTPVFAAECTPASIRGGLVMSWQMWTAFGIFLGFSTNLILYCYGPIAWRLQLISAVLPAVPLVLGIYLCPESPRWYMKKGRYTEAFESFKRLRNTELQAARDLYYVHRQLMEEYKVTKGITYMSRFIELFTIPRLRRATLASWVVMIAQQMCGINIIAFYSSTVFIRAQYSTSQTMWASFVYGLVNWLFAFPAVWTIDTFGRRNLLLFTFPNMAWTLLATGLCFLIPEANSARVPLIALFIILFTTFYSPGEGPVPYTYSAEVFPLTHREMGMSWAVSTCLGLGSHPIYHIPTHAYCANRTFGFYAGLNVLALTMIFFLVPETKQRTLEELDYVFAVPLRKHAAYQGSIFLPYWIKKWVFGQRDAVLEPLYQLEEVESIAVS
ncbi:uncharacterized protein EV420DRAFT_1621066 [Desarmillaria tabescens]|uniref:Major facilitator superfamily (MFS) profile domain-containing protein n=1 Tax=Armillaria tabescens TaxID=1929756 RepID=A0AA39KAJ1_ARMTA|nr:uncharacterized protein EV420DRAFT_1621066 [Desarmillaria tabescens]KAK0457525.1 hypothetical protein EV420DRAFT_1621066 [Desarmillaria tabescens]